MKEKEREREKQKAKERSDKLADKVAKARQKDSAKKKVGDTTVTVVDSSPPSPQKLIVSFQLDQQPAATMAKAREQKITQKKTEKKQLDKVKRDPFVIDYAQK